MTKRKSEEIRRKEILGAALRCFSSRGYHETTLDDISRCSGLTKGAIYWYFKGKREIFLDLIELVLRDDKTLWSESLEEYQMGMEFMVNAGLLYLELHLESRWIRPLYAELVAESYRDCKMRKKISELYDERRGLIKEALDRAIHEEEHRDFDNESISSIMISTIDGLMIQYWLSDKKLDYQRVWTQFVNALFKGIQVNEGIE
ncbi:MAG: TetR/AcrR family transcriptional regulator [Spirochaetota bacterium]|nr:TetR/AcrR family transcriptional regulator [Spirochaetota bacterium]